MDNRVDFAQANRVSYQGFGGSVRQAEFEPLLTK